MSARDKAQAAKLKRIPTEIFDTEARRRGWVPGDKFTLVPTSKVVALRDQLASVVSTMVDGGDLFSCVRTTRHVERELDQYLQINAVRNELNKAGAQ